MAKFLIIYKSKPSEQIECERLTWPVDGKGFISFTDKITSLSDVIDQKAILIVAADIVESIKRLE